MLLAAVLVIGSVGCGSESDGVEAGAADTAEEAAEAANEEDAADGDAVEETAEAAKEAAEPAAKDSASKEAAPDFTVYDFDGNEVHLSDFRGKRVLLNFWGDMVSALLRGAAAFTESL